MIKKYFKKIFNIFYSRFFFLYILCGGIATIIDWGLYSFGIYILNINYIYSVVISFMFGSMTNFSLNKYINFRDKYKKIHYQFTIYLVIAIIGLFLTILFMWVMIDFLLIDKFISRILTTMIVLVYNFLGHRYFTFNIFKSLKS